MHRFPFAILALLSAFPACDPGKDTSTPEDTAVTDGDGDGYLSGEDCNDTDAQIHPNATEVCDGQDNDCDDYTDEGVTTTYYRDADDDGYGSETDTEDGCVPPAGYILVSGDCDDSNPAVNYLAAEACDGVDNNCDGNVDEGVVTLWYVDTDGDGWGDPATTVAACEQPTGTTWVGDDCDDTDPDVHPEADEWCNGNDNDCDGLVLEPDSVDVETWYLDYDKDGYGGSTVSTTSCEQPDGYETTSTDCNDKDATAHPGGTEACDGVDDDCDGTVDEGAVDPTTFYRDADGDLWGDDRTTSSGCEAPAGYVEDPGDCDDTDRLVYPGAAELCNGDDDDCDGTTDESVAYYTWYLDADGDGWGTSSSTRTDCAAVVGYSMSTGDCDDADADVNPGATELCNDADDDCDGTTDEGLVTYTRYRDADGDGYGDPGTSLTDCTIPSGWVADATDCDDDDDTVHPGAPEYCDGDDHDCDSSVYECDSVDAGEFCRDADGDDYGTSSSTTTCCAPPAGYVEDCSDCDDLDADVNPGETDACNGIDDDCTGSKDDAGLCPYDVWEYGDHAYMFADVQLTWDEARAACRDVENYYLVTVEDAAEEAWLLSVEATWPTAVWWIGFVDQIAEGSWGWENLASTSSYTDWCSTEPSGYHGWRCAATDEEDCAVMNFPSTAGATSGSLCWNDTACDCSNDSTYGGPYFVCEAYPL